MSLAPGARVSGAGCVLRRGARSQRLGGEIGALLKSGLFKQRLKAPEAGSAVIQWTTCRPARNWLPRRRRVARAVAPVLVASGKLTFKASGSAVMPIRLTAAGRALLRRVSRVRLTASCTFVAVRRKARAHVCELPAAPLNVMRGGLLGGTLCVSPRAPKAEIAPNTEIPAKSLHNPDKSPQIANFFGATFPKLQDMHSCNRRGRSVWPMGFLRRRSALGAINRNHWRKSWNDAVRVRPLP